MQTCYPLYALSLCTLCEIPMKRRGGRNTVLNLSFTYFKRIWRNTVFQEPALNSQYSHLTSSHGRNFDDLLKMTRMEFGPRVLD